MSIDVTVVSNDGQVIEVSVGEGAAVLDSIDALGARKLDKAGGTVTGPLGMSGQHIYDLQDPESEQDAATAGWTQAQLAAAVSALVDGAPSPLSTLAQLATAIGGDPAFAVNVAAALATKATAIALSSAVSGLAGNIALKLDKAGGTLVGDLGMSGHHVYDVLDPESEQDAATAGWTQARIGEVVGTADSSNDTLGKVGDRVTAADSARVDGDAAIVGGADGSNNTLGKIASRVDTVKSTADEAFANGPQTFETTDLTPRLIVRDEGRRVFAQLPDPQTEINRKRLLVSSSSDFFESTNPGQLAVLDNGGRVFAQFPDPGITAAIASLGASVASASQSALFETTDLAAKAYILDAGNRLIVSLSSSGSGGGSTPDDIATEVATARGNTASLSDRIASLVTADGAPIVGVYQKQYLRQLRYRLAKLARPGVPAAEQVNIGITGDSFGQQAKRWTTMWTEIAVAKYGDGGGGWCGFGFQPGGSFTAPWTVGNQPQFLNGNVRPALYPVLLSGNPAGTYYTAPSPDLALVALAASGDGMSVGIPASPVHNSCALFFVGTSNGAIRYSWDAGATWTNVNVQGSVGILQTVALNVGLPSGAGTIQIEWVSGSARLCGVDLRSAASGVRVHKLAASGSNISNWANAQSPQFDTGIAALALHAVFVLDGTNSQSQNFSGTTWGNYQATHIARCRNARPGIDILLMTPYENQRPANPISMTVYAIEGRKRAQALRVAFLDLQPGFGDPANPGEYGSTGAIPMVDADLIHPSELAGGPRIAADVADAVFPF